MNYNKKTLFFFKLEFQNSNHLKNFFKFYFIPDTFTKIK